MYRSVGSFCRCGVPFQIVAAAFVGSLLFLAEPALGEIHDGYEVRRLGLIGAGYQNSSTQAEAAKAEAINSVGQVIGYSFRYNGTSGIGRAGWIDDGTTTRQLGFVGAGYQHDDGTEESEPTGINAAGHVVGTSERYQGTASLGKVAWVDDGTTLRQIGFTGAGYQKTDGTEVSTPTFINDAGEIVGLSNRFSGASWLGRSIWLDDGTTTSRLGLTGGEFRKNSTGWEYSDANAMNAVGQAIGISERFNSFNNNAGLAAWISDGATTRRIGLAGPEYHRTGTTDEEWSDALFLNDAGHSAGISKWYDANAFRGYAAWLDDGATAHRLGFTGPGYEKTGTGNQESRVDGINSAGQVVGYSVRYDGTSKVGKTVWVDDGTGPRQLGFTGTGFQRTSDGKEESRALAINDAGLVIGESNRYNGTSGGGQAAWLDDGTTLHELGFTGPGYDRNDGYLFSEAQAINEAGQVMGFSKRYDGSSFHGKAGWFYDSATDTLTELIFSTRDDGRVNTDPKVLTADGTLWGLYNKYDGSTDLGRRPFAWDTINGFVDLIDRTENFDDDGWEEVKSQFLFDAIDEGLLTINGSPNGTPSSQSSWYGPHLLVPVAGTIAGDFDTDGDVDAADLAQWQGDFGINNESDADNDGDSDGADFLAWQRNLGEGALSASTAVPEPSCLLLLVLGWPLLLGRRGEMGC